jgi:hypothetical protein
LFGHKLEEVPVGWRQFYNGELHNLRSSLSLLGDKVTEDEMGETCRTHGTLKMHTKIWSEKLKWKDRLGDVGVDERIILIWILKKQSVRM